MPRIVSPTSAATTWDSTGHVTFKLADEWFSLSRSLAASLAPDQAWKAFLADLVARNVITNNHAKVVRAIWSQIVERFGTRFPLPVTQPTVDGALQLAWDRGRYYVDVDIFGDGLIQWFSRDRSTGETDGSDDDERVPSLPITAWRWLERVAVI